MKDEKIRRFSSAEIFLHWTNAVLFLTLCCTGTLILIYRIFEAEIVRYETLSLIHRITGVSLIIVLGQAAIVGVFVKGIRRLWHTQRFNPVQKLHLLVIFTVLLGFSISGLVIMLVPGTLAAWVIHLICFIPAALFLLLHLFLSLINPQTRKSLPSIFTGFISAEYARQHHPQWIGVREIKPHSSDVSWRALTLTIAALAIVMVFAIRYYGPEHAQENIQRLISNRGATSILPGRPAKGHTNDPQLKYCTTCHQSFLTPSSDACLSCHDVIQQRMVQQSGFHGKLTGQCRSCHPEHAGEDADIRNFDTTQFNHDLANYELQGKHSKVSCQKCHLVKEDEDAAEQTKYIGLNFGECTNCHSDPHLDRFKKPCAACHSEDGWKEPYLVFYHNKDTEFAIDQIHSHLACASCHKDIEPPLFEPLATTCEKCHDNIEELSHGIASRIAFKPDPHAGRVTCTQCHQTDKQRQKPADYANKCKSCHNDGYEQLYHNWNMAFELRKSQAEKLLSRLHQISAPEASQIAERITEAEYAGFHNIQLANELWDQILSEYPNGIRDLEEYPEDEGEWLNVSNTINAKKYSPK